MLLYLCFSVFPNLELHGHVFSFVSMFLHFIFVLCRGHVHPELRTWLFCHLTQLLFLPKVLHTGQRVIKSTVKPGTGTEQNKAIFLQQPAGTKRANQRISHPQKQPRSLDRWIWIQSHRVGLYRNTDKRQGSVNISESCLLYRKGLYGDEASVTYRISK